MSSHLYLEDVFIEFYTFIMSGAVSPQYQDVSPCDNFFNLIVSKKQLTENQSRFILKILEKYKKFSANHGLHYQHLLDNPKWKNPFRVIDTSKRIYIEKDSQDNLWLNAKFPYSFKDQFQKEIVENTGISGSHWDPDTKVRRIPFRNCNIIHVYDFAIRNGFEIDDSVLSAVSEVEEIWDGSNDIIPYSKIINNKVFLINACEDVEAWWQQYSTDDLSYDMFLAKTAGFPVIFDGYNPVSDIEKISVSEETHFWIKENDQFFNLYNIVKGTCAIVLDRGCDVKEWISNFVESAEKSGLKKELIRVCFRESNEGNTGFNDWIKQNNLGGTLENAKIFIFQHKPPKWLFKDDVSVKIVVTNGLYPSTSNLTQALTESHPCVVHLGNIKPSAQRNMTIVDL
jgi:hypothetical protein